MATVADEQPDRSRSDGVSVSAGARQWHRLTSLDVGALLAVGVVLLFVTVPRLPPGICFGDSGDLQFAAATLGIAHPPGYAGFVSLGYLASLVPGIDPAYLVSLACLAAGVIALILCALLQIRLGVNSWLAAAVAMVLAGHPRVWGTLIVPEVYVPSLAFLAGCCYLLVKYGRLGRPRDLLIAVVLYGIALGSRPPVLLALPGLLVAWWLAQRRLGNSRRLMIRNASYAGLIVVGICLYSPVYCWLRDRPTTACNYIEQYNAETGELPTSGEGAAAKLERIYWHISARQYAHLLGNSASGVRSKLRYIRNRIGPEHISTLVIAGLIVLLGCVLAFSRCPECAWALCGIALGNVVFLCIYRVYGDAADMLPLLWVLAVFVGVAVSPILPDRAGLPRKLACAAVAVAAGVWMLADAPTRWDAGADQDATGYLSSVDVATLPRGSVICSSWGTSPPLWYAKHVTTGRSDLVIINAAPGKWAGLIEAYLARPAATPTVVYFTQMIDPPGGYRLIPERALYRLRPKEQSAVDEGRRLP